jgi:arginine:pyruvate transaminase
VEKEIWLFNDDVYQEILISSDRASPASLPGSEQVCITISSLSKSHRMTGWRIGWIVGPVEFIAHLRNLSMCMAYGLPEFVMDAATTALRMGTETADDVRINMDRRRKIIDRELDNLPGLDIYSSVGGMYTVLDVRKLGVTSQKFAEDMLDNYDVAVLACDGFGETGKGLIRISLCATDENMEVACDRIAEYVGTLN